MGKLMDENIDGRVRDNVFYDSFREVVDFYKDTKMEIWEDAATLVLIDTDINTGLFDKSDIIIVYDKETCKPSIVTERVYRRNYSIKNWHKLTRYLRLKSSVVKQELGFNVRISYSHGFIDYVHYKEEWWEWASKRQAST